MGKCHFGGKVSASNFDGNNRNLFRICLFQNFNHRRGIAKSFNKQADDARALHFKCIVNVLVHRHRELLAG